MRIIAAAATIAACLTVSFVASGDDIRLPVRSEAAGASTFDPARAPVIGKQTGVSKPSASAGPAARPRGDDSCRWANDNECDDPDIGTGACRMGTDYSDCRALREGENDTCQWARDRECDEPNFGTGACVQGTDLTDCGDVSWMRNQRDSCDTAFNDVCEEPGRGSGSCAARTDRTDCNGRQRPMAINDHFFGQDDRVLVNVNQAPWRFMGQITMDSGSQCTATLIARDVLVTAAHCIHSNHLLAPGGRFEAAGGGTARIIAYHLDPRFDHRRFVSGNEIDGLDWALLRIDRPLGDQLGFASVLNLTGQGAPRATGTDLMQAGYSWDTGGNLSGNLRCRIVTVYPDNTFAHECDTTRGDSGSAFVVRNSDGYAVIGVDSSFRSNPNGPFLYIAVSAAGFARPAADFIAGRIGNRVGRPATGGGNKPGGPVR